jgi:hypothetical protein
MEEEQVTEVVLTLTVEKKMDVAHLCYSKLQQSIFCLCLTIRIVKESAW